MANNSPKHPQIPSELLCTAASGADDSAMVTGVCSWHAGIALMSAGAGGLDVAGSQGTMALLCSKVTSPWSDFHALWLDG